MAVTARALSTPLCVDLDRCVIRTDLVLESLLWLVKRNPLYLAAAILWLVRGRTVLHSELASRVSINPAALPYNRALLDWLEDQRAGGRVIWLRAPVSRKLADTVAAHLGIFDGVIGGDTGADLDGFARAPAFPARASRLKAVWRALRPHQWAKNVLVLVPLLSAHLVGNATSVLNAMLAMLAFCLCASSVYVLNDMLDLEADRAHARKSKRPFAAGDLPLTAGFALVPGLLAAAALIAAFLPPPFWLALAGYYALTFAYSFVLKGLVIVDAMALAGLYTFRIIAGAAAVSVPLSFWLVLFSVFLFLSLAMVKRYAELDALRRRHQLQAVGRGYHVEDLPMLEGLGIAGGYLSVLVLALYINSPSIAPLYHRPQALWPLCALLLYWVSRIWMKTHRGRMHDDPVVFALRDRVSLGIGLLAAITVMIAM